VSSPALIEIETERLIEDEPSSWYEGSAMPATDEALVSSAYAVKDTKEPRRDDSQDRAEFDLIADELASATVGLGSLRAATRHPAYGEILAMGQRAVPFLLERVEDPIQGPLWMRLLGSLIGFPPMLRMDTVADAAEAWRIWGHAFDSFVR
jgi:hypothetical protein